MGIFIKISDKHSELGLDRVFENSNVENFYDRNGNWSIEINEKWRIEILRNTRI